MKKNDLFFLETQRERCRQCWFSCNCLFCLIFGLLVITGEVITGEGLAFSQTTEKVTPADTNNQLSTFPWYDPGSQEVRPIKSPQRPKSRTGNRNQVPARQISSPNNRGSAGQTSSGTASLFSNFLNTMLWTLLGILLAVVAFVLVWAFLRPETKQRKFGLRKVFQRSLAASVEQLPLDTGDAPGDFLGIAGRAYQLGDFRTAIIYLFSHVLVTLDQSDLIRLRKGKTNRQYAKELGEQQALRQYFIDVMHPFETVFFGNQELDRESFEPCWHGLQTFQQEIDRQRKGSVS